MHLMNIKTTFGILVVLSAVVGATVLMLPSLASTAHAQAAAVGGAAAGGGSGGGGAASGSAAVVGGGSSGPSFYNSPLVSNFPCLGIIADHCK